MLTCLLGLSLGAQTLRIETDKARYEPGRPVEIRVQGPVLEGSKLSFRILHLDSQVWSTRDEPWKGKAGYQWPAPRVGHGFLAVAELLSASGRVLEQAS